MKNRVLIILSVVFCIFSISLIVNAANSVAAEGDANFNELKSAYEQNKNNKIPVSGSEIITLYGYSKCDGTKCVVDYMGVSSDFEEALRKTVQCTNGEKYINYQNSGPGGAADYMEDNNKKYSGDAYWSVDYQVTCTTDSNNGNNLETDNGLNNVVNDNQNNNNNNQNNNDNNSNYGSSSTVDNEKTGVNTYFVVLGIVALISSIFMVCVKKFNLFKNI